MPEDELTVAVGLDEPVAVELGVLDRVAPLEISNSVTDDPELEGDVELVTVDVTVAEAVRDRSGLCDNDDEELIIALTVALGLADVIGLITLKEPISLEISDRLKIRRSLIKPENNSSEVRIPVQPMRRDDKEEKEMEYEAIVELTHVPST